MAEQTAIKSASFHGPLFLVGMPRSGTKLLRGILNEHSRVRIPDVESQFLPYWMSHWHEFGSLGSQSDFRRFAHRCQRLPFFIQNSQRGIDVDWRAWFENCESFSPAAVFEGLLKCVLDIPADDRATIWGDKSPSYLRHIPLLKSAFPEARIIHIIRDVRDYSLSVKKAWGKSALRAAQRWHDDVSKARRDGTQIHSDYIEVRYEDLVTEPPAVLKSVCAFLDIEASNQMLTLSRAPENLGDAKGSRMIMSDNVGKYRLQMSARTIAAIERITASTLRDLGYPCEYVGKPQRIPRWKLKGLQALDGVQLVRSGMSTHGVIGAIVFQLRSFRTSGNRQQ